MRRLRELDFLRGLAILLVLFRHQYLVEFTVNMGWIGVDLFFVLSGFLVSGLLFKEYLKFGNIQPKRFLIRRGFKIYPIYFIFYILYLIPIINGGSINYIKLFADMTFIQNYVCGWGYANAPSWSLAIEEHFYVCFSLFLWLGLKKSKIEFKRVDNKDLSSKSFELFVIPILILCLCFRLFSNITFPEQMIRNYTMTHLRIDSLLAGVLISYFYYFKINNLTKVYQSYKYVLFIIAFLGLVWTPFIEPIPSFFVKTIGFTFLYIAFSIILLYFLLENEINQKLNSVFSSPIVTIVSKIGYSSYSIYIIHNFVNSLFDQFVSTYQLDVNLYTKFIITFILSISCGMLMTYKIENYFLKIRDKYYPSRVL